jgi:predicted PilT family ATPase
MMIVFRRWFCSWPQYEAQQGHAALARDIRMMVDKAKRISSKVIPINREFNGLIQSMEAEHKLSELVVTDDLKARVERILKEFRQQDKLKKHGMNNRREILLVGPPGIGNGFGN